MPTNWMAGLQLGSGERSTLPFPVFYNIPGLKTNPQGTVPGAPAGAPVTPAAPQATALKSNITNIDDITALANAINAANQKAQQTANMNRIPGEQGLEIQSSANIGSALRGEVPADVIAQLANAAATRGVSTGSPWGASTNADYLRSLGLTSLERQNQGQQWLTSAAARNPTAPLYDTGNLVITPQQQAAIDAQKAQLAQQLQLAQLEDQTRRWIASLDANTRLASSRSGSPSYGGFGGGKSPAASPAMNWEDFFGDFLNPKTSTGGTSTGTTPQDPNFIWSPDAPNMLSDPMSNEEFDWMLEAGFDPYNFDYLGG